MLKDVIILLCLFGVSKSMNAQKTEFGVNNYIEYQAGTLPVILTVAHGGRTEPLSIPDRICNNAVYVTDAYTIETALEIKKALFALTGCYPHLIICHLKRTKLDCNRNKTEAACGNTEAETAWTEFHNFITAAINTVEQNFNNKGFLVDIHGHGNTIQRIELGYLLSDTELGFSDDVLNTNQYINYSSIKKLALSNTNNYTHAQLLRGNKAFGTLLMLNNYPAVPSEQIPSPGTSSNYFSGGYIIANHTCYNQGISINGVQMELNQTGIRNSAENRTKFAIAFAGVIIDFVTTHFNINLDICNVLSGTPPLRNNNTAILISPNPVKRGNTVTINGAVGGNTNYEVYNISGNKLTEGVITLNNNKINTDNLLPGLYFVKINTAFGSETQILKLVITN